MRQTTRFVTYVAAFAVAAPLAAAIGNSAGTAGAANNTVLPFAQMLRRCDFSETDFNGPTGMGRVFGVMTSTGSTVKADVQTALAIPGTHYDVRLIQVPRPSSANCWGGDPGVAQGALNTDGAGAASVTLEDTIEPGATGAWVFVSRPHPFSQDPAEFYTTDLIVPI
ncbi:MAG: hypothetical protein QOD39_1591 [Mycobacterium sp.]|jgi:hypothetical protein|nr:hypothetical protein [Mycobacterium sp.]